MPGFDLTLFSKGGPMMAVLLGLAVLLLVLGIERTLYLHRGQIRAQAFVDTGVCQNRPRRLALVVAGWSSGSSSGS